jgi:hypothetical protein
LVEYPIIIEQEFSTGSGSLYDHLSDPDPAIFSGSKCDQKALATFYKIFEYFVAPPFLLKTAKIHLGMELIKSSLTPRIKNFLELGACEILVPVFVNFTRQCAPKNFYWI